MQDEGVRTRYVPDRGLSTRMGATVVLLGLLYVVLMVVLVSVGLAWPLVLLLGCTGLLVQWYASDSLAMSAMKARLVSPTEFPQLHAVVDRLCALADMPKPRIAVSDSDLPNAFATGRSPDRAVVCVTTGLLRRLDERELEAVLSHELSHVAHRDVLVMTVASVVGIAAGLLVRMTLWGGLGRRRGNDQNAALVMLAVVLVSVAVYALSFLLLRTLSRYRELSADRAGALLTGQPSALASARVKVSSEMGRIPTRDLRAAEGCNALFFAPALSPGFSLSTLFATHPPLEVRLDRLARLSAELGRRT